MLMQPEDIRQMTAAEAIADIDTLIGQMADIDTRRERKNNQPTPTQE